jgi:hypothetical protein
MRRVRLTRRKLIVLVLLVGALVEATAALAVFAKSGDGQPKLNTALPMHPVAGNFKPDGTKLADCSSQACFEQAFGNLAYYKGPKVALAAFAKKYGDYSDPGCHRVAHRIGSATLARNHGDVAKTFAEGSSACFSGYYHGVLERSLLQVKSYDPATLGKVVRGLCTSVEKRFSMFLAYQCLHGLGHGLMITTGYDLPLALKVCDRLSNYWQTTSCNGGVFMENIATFYGVTSRYLRDDDLLYPCDAVATPDKIKCYEISTSRVLPKVGWDWTKASQICASAERGWSPTCFRSLGRDVSGVAHQRPAEIKRLCAYAKPFGGEVACIGGAAWAGAGNFKNGLRAAQLCQAVSGRSRAVCYYRIGTVMVLYGPTPAKRKADCRAITGNAYDVKQCVQGGKDYLAYAAGRDILRYR